MFGESLVWGAVGAVGLPKKENELTGGTAGGILCAFSSSYKRKIIDHRLCRSPCAEISDAFLRSLLT